MFKDKYPCIFSLQVEAVVFITRKVSLQRADKMFSNNQLFAARGIYFSLFSGITL